MIGKEVYSSIFSFFKKDSWLFVFVQYYIFAFCTLLFVTPLCAMVLAWIYGVPILEVGIVGFMGGLYLSQFLFFGFLGNSVAKAMFLFFLIGTLISVTYIVTVKEKEAMK